MAFDAAGPGRESAFAQDGPPAERSGCAVVTMRQAAQTRRGYDPTRSASLGGDSHCWGLSVEPGMGSLVMIVARVIAE